MIWNQNLKRKLLFKVFKMKEKVIKTESIDIILNFLKKTKNGEYAKIEKSSLEYIRIDEQPESINSSEEEYYYSIS